MSAPTNLAEWQEKDLRMLFFSSEEERVRNRQILRQDEELKDFAYMAYDPLPIVHVKAIPLLKKKGLKFQVSKPVTYSTLTPAERKLLGEKKAFFRKVGDLVFLIRRPPPEWPESERWHHEKT